MSSDTPHHGCTGKQGFPNAFLAKEIAARSRRRKDTPVNAYRCHLCAQWHIGSVNPVSRKRVLSRKSRMKGNP